jgi:hypothetical protein
MGFIYAEQPPVFEETEEKVSASILAPFAAEEPIFEEDDEKNACSGCENGEGCNHQINNPEAGLFFKEKEDQLQASYVSWRRYKANFGMEKLFVRFPQKPAATQSGTYLTAYAYDYGVMYSVTGYFPPVGNIHPTAWFDEILFLHDHYPFNLVSHVIFQVSNGDWILDYTAHDYVKNLIIKGRSIVTPFNGYTLQCVKPNGMRDYFDYFLDSFYLRCGCM